MVEDYTYNISDHYCRMYHFYKKERHEGRRISDSYPYIGRIYLN